MTVLAGLLRSLRARQWVKNAACFAGVVFSGRLFDGAALLRSAGVFALFCLAASAVYVLNDLCDRQEDRRHPRKAARPIASGEVPAGWAAAWALLLLAGAAAGALRFGPALQAILASYLALNLLYTLWWRRLPVLDLLPTALGFVLRVLAGIAAVGVPATPWILLCIFFLALFLAAGKRHGELARSGDGAREALRRYSAPFLQAVLSISAAMAILCYALFTVLSGKDVDLLLTVPIVVYGVLRYLHLLLVRGEGEAPEETILSDGPLLAAIAVWLAACVAVLYFDLSLIAFDVPHAAVGLR